ALFDLAGQHDRAARQIATHRARFDLALETAATNITEAGEAAAVEAIGKDRDEYYRRLDVFLKATSDRITPHFDVLEPQFDAVRAQADQLLRVNQEAMRRKADEASRIARRWFFVTLALAMALMAAGIAIEVGLSRAILGPVRQLTDATTRVAGGDLDA